MTADGRAARNQANAQKSTGPKTEVGKAAAARNSRRHGATAQPKRSAINSWLSVILDQADITTSDLMPVDERGFRALALARAEAQVIAAEQALRDFEDTAISPNQTAPGQINDITAMLRELSDHARRSREMQINAAVLRMLRHSEREEQVLGRRRHQLLMRYARETRSRKKRAFAAWLEVVRDKREAA